MAPKWQAPQYQHSIGAVPVRSFQRQVALAAAPQRDPPPHRKISPIDAVAVMPSKSNTAARDAMLLRTHTAIAPWHIVRTNNKRLARLNLIRDILSRLDYAGKKAKLVQPDPAIAFASTPDCIESQRLAR